MDKNRYLPAKVPEISAGIPAYTWHCWTHIGAGPVTSQPGRANIHGEGIIRARIAGRGARIGSGVQR